MRNKTVIAAALLASSVLASSAEAKLVDITTFGKLSSGTGAFYAGEDYSFRLTYDDASTPQPTYDQGGAVSFDGTTSFALGNDRFDKSGLSGLSFRYDPNTSVLSSFLPADSGVVRTNFMINLNRSDPAMVNPPSAAEIFGKALSIDFFGYSSSDVGPDGITRFSTATALTTVGAVPEPATWGMMILGMGMIGGVMRRRKNVRTTVKFA